MSLKLLMHPPPGQMHHITAAPQQTDSPSCNKSPLTSDTRGQASMCERSPKKSPKSSTQKTIGGDAVSTTPVRWAKIPWHTTPTTAAHTALTLSLAPRVVTRKFIGIPMASSGGPGSNRKSTKPKSRPLKVDTKSTPSITAPTGLFGSGQRTHLPATIDILAQLSNFGWAHFAKLRQGDAKCRVITSRQHKVTDL